MESQISNNKRILKNTVFLYIRMLLVMIVTLFTSRVILSALGESDYGLYNVIGGVVTTFTFLTSALGNSAARYITYALGKGDKENTESVFLTALWIHVILALLLFLVAETAGLWFVNTQMSIPDDRLIAANWVYQFSIVTTLFSIINIPFYSEIVAHERMSAFAYISIFDIALKLAVVYMLYISPIDKLIFYSFLLMSIQIIDITFYIVYCKRNFAEVKFRFRIDKVLVGEMSKFAGWCLIGNLAFVCYTQGLNILLNIFFGPVVNAARAIAVQVQTAVMSFIQNFQTAVSPQITKSYAQQDIFRLEELLEKTTKYSFYILLCMLLPISLEAEWILRLWLENVPEHTVSFLRLILLISIIECLTRPITIAMNATGDIKKYQIVSCGILLLILPTSYFVLKIGLASESVFIVHFTLALIALLAEIIILYDNLGISILNFVKSVLYPILKVVVFAIIPPIVLCYYVNESLTSHILVFFISLSSVIICVYTVGINKAERLFVKEK